MNLSYLHLTWHLSCVGLLCAVFQCKHPFYFDNYVKMKAVLVAVYLYSFLLSFIPVESINKNVFSLRAVDSKNTHI